MQLRTVIALLATLAMAACGPSPGASGGLSGISVGSPYGGGTLGGVDSRREGGMRNLYGWP